MLRRNSGLYQLVYAKLVLDFVFTGLAAIECVAIVLQDVNWRFCSHSKNASLDSLSF